MILTRPEVTAILRYRLTTALQALDDGNLAQVGAELERVNRLLEAALAAPEFPGD